MADDPADAAEVKPFSMALLGWLFIRVLFADWLPAEQIDSYIAGLIILAAAPCTAMVFVWSNLTNGHPGFTLTQVALNDVIMVFAFAPIVALLLGIASITVGVRGTRGGKTRKPVACPATAVTAGATDHAGIAVRFSGQADHRTAAHYPAAGDTHFDTGVFQFRTGLSAQSPTAISLYGLNSGAALATVVGVLVEVPVMLSVVRIVNATRPWYQQATGTQA